MKIVMGGDQEIRKIVSKTVLSMVAGACGCIGSFVSLLISLGVGTGAGFLATLTSNIPIFFIAAGLLSLISLKLAANTFSRISGIPKVMKTS